MSTGVEVFELVTVTKLGMLALFSSGARDLICLFRAVTAVTMAEVSKMESSRKEGFHESRKYSTPLAEWIRASHTSEAVWAGVGPEVVLAVMTVVSKSVHTAWFRFDHLCRRATPNPVRPDWPHATCSFASPPPMVYG